MNFSKSQNGWTWQSENSGVHRFCDLWQLKKQIACQIEVEAMLLVCAEQFLAKDGDHARKSGEGYMGSDPWKS